jgi:hypothetical protein
VDALADGLLRFRKNFTAVVSALSITRSFGAAIALQRYAGVGSASQNLYLGRTAESYLEARADCLSKR